MDARLLISGLSGRDHRADSVRAIPAFRQVARAYRAGNKPRASATIAKLHVLNFTYL